MKLIGIRREDKNIWEKRVPLVPEDSAELLQNHNIKTLIQPSDIRTFSNKQYELSGAEINEDVFDANLLLAVKEIPLSFIKNNKTYVFFSHTIKGQPYNMPLLKELMEKSCNLVDYEKIVDEKGRRLIFFGKYAGVAGMIETLHAYGKKMELQGKSHPFQKIKQAYEYPSIETAIESFKKIAEDFKLEKPVYIGISGYGNVSKGAQEILDILPVQEISAEELLQGNVTITQPIVKVVFMEKDMVTPKTGEFDLQTYFTQPEKFNGRFSDYLGSLDILVNCIYWTEAYPRLVTKEYLKSHYDKVKLEVIGDISCDINGSIELTYKSTYPDHATYTYYGNKDEFVDGTQENGVTVMAIDNLPCEFPRESSSAFSEILKGFIPALLDTDFSKDFNELGLPYPLEKALILHQGKLTPDFQYLEAPIKEFGGSK